MRKSYSFFRTIIRFLITKFFGLELIHSERIQRIQNCLIAANHISNVDPPCIGSILPFEIYYLAKAELFQIKIIGNFLKHFNAIPLRRGSIDRKALIKTHQILEKGNSLLLFPEGSRKSFKAKAGIGKIAYEMQKNIYPIYIQNSNHLWSCLIRKKRLQIVIGEPIIISDFFSADLKKMYYEIAEYTLKQIYELKNDCENS